MLEELRENVLSLLEERVERAIGVIEGLREDKASLESQINQLQGEFRTSKTEIKNSFMLNLI